MNTIPRDESFDSTLDVVREGFPFIYKRTKRYQSDIFQIRLMGLPAICLHGQEAAAVFYDNERFMRTGAIPRRIQTTLMGLHGIQTLDGEKHQQRKALFMSVMTPGSLHKLMEYMAADWRYSIKQWTRQEQVVLFPEVQELLCRAACTWAGVPLAEEEVTRRTRDFRRMVDAFGGVGPRHWRGKRARSRAEKWIEGIIKQIRKEKLQVPEESAAYRMAWYREPDGKLMDSRMAAIELINIVRPITAIGWYITFAALALHEHPEARARLRTGDEEYLEWFMHEVRRYYPFAPFLGNVVRKDFEWHGYKFPKGRLVLLDVYGTNRDPRQWHQPESFRPERFRSWNGSAYNFIPQGGGDYFGGHRCAGEWLTIETVKLAITYLTRGMTYDVPAQDLCFPLDRMPTLPKSSFIIENVRSTNKVGAAPSLLGCPFHRQMA
ncbi:cytochrome P450 [Hymenobacter sp. GOD-10R]|uniref:cytochrome P450 n=1 Tax=Hymenobacter sp. GOD-10R TaxID=3093922 RepID=UPI002D76EB72|nr:cytochrome P450 [Hymenobacter sp. GOD-10R]WRQ30048.1 cytochrome P450 [Hymenobacter sp. GOD-10R]